MTPLRAFSAVVFVMILTFSVSVVWNVWDGGCAVAPTADENMQSNVKG